MKFLTLFKIEKVFDRIIKYIRSLYDEAVKQKNIGNQYRRNRTV